MNKAFVAAALAATVSTGCASLPHQQELDIRNLEFTGISAESVPVPSYTMRNLAPVTSPKSEKLEISALFEDAKKGTQYTMSCSEIMYNRISASHYLNERSWLRPHSDWKRFDAQLKAAEKSIGCLKVMI